MIHFIRCRLNFFFFFFFNDTATTEIYTLSLHDALPIWNSRARASGGAATWECGPIAAMRRSEEHTSELQSQSNLVCRLLLEKKKKKKKLQKAQTYTTTIITCHVHHM